MAGSGMKVRFPGSHTLRARADCPRRASSESRQGNAAPQKATALASSERWLNVEACGNLQGYPHRVADVTTEPRPPQRCATFATMSSQWRTTCGMKTSRAPVYRDDS